MPTASPISRMTSEIDESTGISWLGSATSPVVAITAVSASRSGAIAATAEPKTSSRMISAAGSASRPTLASMLLNFASSFFSVLTLPSSSIVNSGCRACAFATAASTLSMYLAAWS